jgi:hypothetical protein
VGALIIAGVLRTTGEARPPQAGGRLGTLEVMIEGFRSARGHARVALFNRDAGFPDNESAAYRSALAEITNGRVRVRFDDLPFGLHISREDPGWPRTTERSRMSYRSRKDSRENCTELA